MNGSCTDMQNRYREGIPGRDEHHMERKANNNNEKRTHAHNDLPLR